MIKETYLFFQKVGNHIGTGGEFYWTSSLYYYFGSCRAWALYMEPNDTELTDVDRCSGLQIRPVCP